MPKEKQDKSLKEWGSRRRIDILTPDTFLRKMIMISTTCNVTGAETARCDVSALNYFCLNKEFEAGEHWKKLKFHKDWKTAIRFHEKYIAKLRFNDTKKCD